MIRVLASLFAAVMLASLGVGGFEAPSANAAGECRVIDPHTAFARGWATPLRMRDSLTGTFVELGPSSTNQTGPGSASRQASVGSVRFPPPGGATVTATLGTSNSTGSVPSNPLSAHQTTTASVVDLNILSGLVRASTARSVATADTTMNSAFVKSDGTTIQDLVVNGVSYTNAAPNTKINLPPEAAGAGSYVVVHERIDVASFPGTDGPADIFYKANTTVRALHVYLTDYSPQAGAQSLEVVVSESIADARTPTPFCGGDQSVLASAYTARVRAPGSSGEGQLVGYVSIPEVGGYARQQLAGTQVGFLWTNSSESRATGSVILDSSSTSQSVSKVYGLCIRSSPDAECSVTATAIRSESDSFANASAAFSWGHLTLTNLRVGGTDVCVFLHLESTCSPPKNTKITINGINVTLNERVHDAPLAGHTGYTVRGVRIQSPSLGDVIIGRTYSAAAYT